MSKTGWVVLIIIVVLVLLGLWYWGMGGSTQAPMEATTTPTQITTTGTPAATGQIPTVGQTVPPAGSNANTTFTAQVAITGFTAQNQTDFPLVNYAVTGTATGSGFFSLIGQNTNTVVWGANQPIIGTYTLDPNSITVPDNGPTHKITAGDYFIRVQDSTGATVGESKPFRIAAGQTTGN